LISQIQKGFRTKASNLGTPSKCTIILLHAAYDCPGGVTAAIARHVGFAQITCPFSQCTYHKTQTFEKF